MAANRGVETFLSVFLLCCWQGTELQPIKTTTGQNTEGLLNSTTENIPEALDEILAQEILEPKTSTVSEISPRQKSSSVPTTVNTKAIINAGIDDSYQEEAFENYHEFLENLENLSTKNKNGKNDRSTPEGLHGRSSHTKFEPHLNPEASPLPNVVNAAKALQTFCKNCGTCQRHKVMEYTGAGILCTPRGSTAVTGLRAAVVAGQSPQPGETGKKTVPQLNYEENNSNGDVYGKLSVLDKLLENIGQSEGSLELTESIF